MAYDVEWICNHQCKCGENPLYNDRTGLFYWSDIPTGRLFQLDPATGVHEVIYQGPQVGGFTFQDDDKLLLFRVTDIALRHDDGTVESIRPFGDEGVPRFNDVIADPKGRVFAGTMGKDLRGGLYRLELDGELISLWRGTNCSNGMAFTEDHATMYWTDSTAKCIYAYDYDEATGRLTNRRTVVGPPDEGTHDGMTIDTEGRLYSARFGGAGVFIFSPDGRPLDTIEMPCSRITSCVFGGPDLDTLYITTAGGDPDDPKQHDGALYRVKLDATGRPEFRSAIVVQQ